MYCTDGNELTAVCMCVCAGGGGIQITSLEIIIAPMCIIAYHLHMCSCVQPLNDE